MQGYEESLLQSCTVSGGCFAASYQEIYHVQREWRGHSSSTGGRYGRHLHRRDQRDPSSSLSLRRQASECCFLVALSVLSGAPIWRPSLGLVRVFSVLGIVGLLFWG